MHWLLMLIVPINNDFMSYSFLACDIKSLSVVFHELFSISMFWCNTLSRKKSVLTKLVLTEK